MYVRIKSSRTRFRWENFKSPLKLLGRTQTCLLKAKPYGLYVHLFPIKSSNLFDKSVSQYFSMPFDSTKVVEKHKKSLQSFPQCVGKVYN